MHPFPGEVGVVPVRPDVDDAVQGADVGVVPAGELDAVVVAYLDGDLFDGLHVLRHRAGLQVVDSQVVDNGVLRSFSLR